MKYIRGTKVILKGTKNGVIDSDWNTYFGDYGYGKGSIMTINHIEYWGKNRTHYFMEKGKRNTTSGFLTEEDFIPINSSWKSRLMEPKAL